MSTARVARSVKLDPEIDARLTALAERTGRTKSFYMNRAIESALEEIELAYSLQAELEDIRSGRATSVSLDGACDPCGRHVSSSIVTTRSLYPRVVSWERILERT